MQPTFDYSAVDDILSLYGKKESNIIRDQGAGEDLVQTAVSCCNNALYGEEV